MAVACCEKHNGNAVVLNFLPKWTISFLQTYEWPMYAPFYCHSSVINWWMHDQYFFNFSLLSFFLFACLFWPLLPTHYRCRGFWLNFITLIGHTTVGGTPLDQRSVRRKELYLTTHNIYNRETVMSPAEFELTIPASELPQPHALNRAVSGTGSSFLCQNTHAWSPKIPSTFGVNLNRRTLKTIQQSRIIH